MEKKLIHFVVSSRANTAPWQKKSHVVLLVRTLPEPKKLTFVEYIDKNLLLQTSKLKLRND